MTVARRSFLLAGLALAPGLVAGQAAVRRVGYLSGGAPGTNLAAALARHGWMEGRNLRLETRVSDRFLPQTSHDAAARELVDTRPDVIVAFFRDRVGAVARATRSIPIVAGLHDPVLEGFAQSLARPGGNVTGITYSSPEAMELLFGLLGAVLPGLRRIHALGPRAFHGAATVVSTRRKVTAARGFVFVPHAIETNADADRALAAIRNVREEAIVIIPMRDFDYADFAAKAQRARVATLDTAGQIEAGLLMSGGMTHLDPWARLGSIVDQVLRGADPAVIPFEQPTHVELILNRRTAAAIGVTFPQEVLLRATKLID